MDATVPFETTWYVRDTCLCLHAQRAARVLARRFDDALRPAGLTNEQFSLLMTLNRPEPAPVGKISALLGTDRTTLTAALKPLMRRGLVERRSDQGDRRLHLLALTADGLRSLAEALPLWTSAHAALEGELKGVDTQGLRDGLTALGKPVSASVSTLAPSVAPDAAP